MPIQIGEAYIPTVINGITASTAIVLGFAGVLIGLLYREIFPKDKITRDLLLIIASFFAVPIIYLYSVYLSLVQGNLTSSIKTAFIGLITATFAFLVVLFFALYKKSTTAKKTGKGA